MHGNATASFPKPSHSMMDRHMRTGTYTLDMQSIKFSKISYVGPVLPRIAWIGDPDGIAMGFLLNSELYSTSEIEGAEMP